MPAPANDNYASPTVLNPAGETLSAITTKEATFEGSEVQLGYKEQSIWFTFTPSSTGWYRFKIPKSSVTANGSGSPTWSLSAYLKISSVITDFTSSGVIDSDGLNDTATYSHLYVHGFLTSGTTYTLKVFTNLGSGPDTPDKFTAQFDLTVEAISPPANDAFASPETISGTSGTTPGTTWDAYDETNEPVVGSDDHDCSVWYEFTPPSSSVYSIGVANADLTYVGTRPPGGSWGQITVAVWDESAAWDETDIANYTYANKLAYSATAFTDDLTPSDAIVYADLAAGTTYRIKVWSVRDNNSEFNIEATDFVLQWDLIPPPDNDDFVDAEVITGESGSATPDLHGATAETGEPAAFYWTDPATVTSVWYSWTCPTSGRYLFRAGDATHNWQCAIYTGSAVNALTPISKNEDGDAVAGVAAVGLVATAGTTYKIQIDGQWGTGAGALAWEKITDLVGGSQAEAVVIPVGGVQTGMVDNYGSTAAAPADADSRFAAFSGYTGGDTYHFGAAIWFKVEATTMAVGFGIQVTDEAASSEFGIFAYDGDLNPLQTSDGYDAVAISDYDVGIRIPTSATNFGSADNDNVLEVSVTPGDVAYFVVCGFYVEEWAP